MLRARVSPRIATTIAIALSLGCAGHEVAKGAKPAVACELPFIAIVCCPRMLGNAFCDEAKYVSKTWRLELTMVTVTVTPVGE